MLDDLQLSSEKQKGSKLFLFQKVKLLSDVSKKPIPNSRPALTLPIYSPEMFYFPSISHLNYTENTGPISVEGIVNCSGGFLQLITTWPVSKALVDFPG